MWHARYVDTMMHQESNRFTKKVLCNISVMHVTSSSLVFDCCMCALSFRWAWWSGVGWICTKCNAYIVLMNQTHNVGYPKFRNFAFTCNSTKVQTHAMTYSAFEVDLYYTLRTIGAQHDIVNQLLCTYHAFAHIYVNAYPHSFLINCGLVL